MPEFNPQQKAAICAKNPSLLCSAGAGSGKTTVMIESIIQKLSDDPSKDIGKFLVITFTNDAALNMKHKLNARLSQLAAEGKEFAARALTSLDNAFVGTIHAFCKNLITSYFYAIEGLPPKFDVMEEAKLEGLFRDAYEQAVEEILGSDHAGFSKDDVSLVRNLMISFSQDELLKMVRSLYKALMGIPDPFTYLSDFVSNAAKGPDANPWAKEVLFSARMGLSALPGAMEALNALMSPSSPEKCVEAVENDNEVIASLLEALEGDVPLSEMSSLISKAKTSMKTVTLRKLDASEQDWYDKFKQARQKIKGSGGILDGALKSIQGLMSEADKRDNQIIHKQLKGLQVLTFHTGRVFRQMKLDLHGIDYSDMEQYAYEIMKDETIRSAVTKEITDIYVDECQDVSGIQYSIINAVSGGKGQSVCRVGDIKQSIYGFRNAAPYLMAKDIEQYSIDSGADKRKIYFQENYRSAKPIVECVNEVFDLSMDRKLTEIDYTDDDHLKSNAPGEEPVDVILLKQADKETDILRAQCEAAVEEIEKLVEKGYEYKDIVILLRKARNEAPEIIRHLQDLHVPVYFDGGSSFYTLSEVSSFLALVSVIDNDHTDVELIGALRGSPFDFTEEEIALIRKRRMDSSWFYEAFRECCGGDDDLSFRCKGAYAQICEWRKMSRQLKVSEFIWHLMRESGTYSIRGAYPDGKLRQANLDLLYHKAVMLEKSGVNSLSAFLREIREIREAPASDSDTPARMGESDNFVRVMTMHKSKGLEFPVVIIMNAHKDISKAQSRTNLKYDISIPEAGNDPLGVYLPASSRKYNTRRDTYGLEAFKVRSMRNAISENTRLLYVAMTRAMEKLIVIGRYEKKSLELWLEKDRLHRIWQTKSMLDMLMPAVLAHTDLPDAGEVSAGHWHVCVKNAENVQVEVDEMARDALSSYIVSVIKGDAQKPECMWMGEEADTAPLKTSVTSIIQDNNPAREDRSFFIPSDEEETAETKRSGHVRGFLLGETPQRPEFIEAKAKDAASAGTATHRFLRLIDLDLFKGISDRREAEKIAGEELKRMVSGFIMTQEEASMVNIRNVAAFLVSPVGRRILDAEVIYREWPFTFKPSASSQTLVQGVIDAAAIEDDGKWLLIDYKTDYDTRPEVFVPKHEMQMNWYREAVERISGIPVGEMWLVALKSGEAFQVRELPIAETA